jgi:hypothetical protein
MLLSPLVLLPVVVAARHDRQSSSSGSLPPFGTASPPSTLEAFSGLPPSTPPQPLDRLSFGWSARPRVRVRKQLPEQAIRVRGREYLFQGFVIGCTVESRGASLEARLRDPVLGGQIELCSGSRIEWSKLWLFPGLSDAATRVEVRTGFDLRAGRAQGELKLGLRGVRKRGLSLVRRVPFARGKPSGDEEARVGSGPHCSVDVGATLTLPDELKLGTEGGLRALSEAAHVEMDIDTLDLIVELS